MSIVESLNRHRLRAAALCGLVALSVRVKPGPIVTASWSLQFRKLINFLGRQETSYLDGTMTRPKSRCLDDPPMDMSPAVVTRRARRARVAMEQRMRRLYADSKALHENSLVICEVGVAASGTGAALFELRKRRNIDDGWIDLEDTLLCRPRRTGQDCPTLWKAHFKRSLKRTAMAAKQGMALRNRTLPAPRRVSVYGSGGVAPVTPVSRDDARGRNYVHTLLPELLRVHATELDVSELNTMADDIAAGALREVVRRLDQFERSARS